MAEADAVGKPAGKMGPIATLGGLTVLAILAGGAVGKLVSAHPPVTAVEHQGTPATRGAPSDLQVKELPAIVTNLAKPSNTHIRLQVAILFSKKNVENVSLLGARISDDIMAFLKTLSLSQLQGASGLQNLREDLNERAAVRSQGSVHEVIIETLATQ
jgi:Flagellar basal body-associated protein